MTDAVRNRLQGAGDASVANKHVLSPMKEDTESDFTDTSTTMSSNSSSLTSKKHKEAPKSQLSNSSKAVSKNVSNNISAPVFSYADQRKFELKVIIIYSNHYQPNYLLF
jgi:hypothetical protein